jgi:hypothetical protein
MSPRIRQLFTFPIDAELLDALRVLEARDGISKAEQIRRGIGMWLKSKRVPVKKAAPRRVSPRRKA